MFIPDKRDAHLFDELRYHIRSFRELSEDEQLIADEAYSNLVEKLIDSDEEIELYI